MTSKRWFEACFFLFFAFAAACPAAAQEAGSGRAQEKDLKAAVDYYKSGNLQGAVAVLEELLKTEPGNARARDMLTEVLVVSSVESYLLNNEDESYRSLSRAMEIQPDIQAVNRLYESIKSEKMKASAGRKMSSALPADAEAFRTVVENLVQGQKEIISATQQSLNKIVETSGQGNKQILESLDKRENLLVTEIGHGRRYSFWLILGGIGILVLTVGLILYTAHRIAARREKLLMEQSEKFVQMMQEQSGKALEHISQTLAALPQIAASNSPTPLLEDDVSAKMRRIDILDAEIVKEGSESASPDVKIMESLLADPNPEVRARAIQVLLKYDSAEAYRRIREMLSNQHSGVRVLAVKLLGGIATAESAAILIQLLKDEDLAVKRQSMVALRTLLSEDLQEETKEQINIALSFISEKEGWVVK